MHPANPEATDHLLARAGTGDAAAWSQLVWRCQQRLRVLLRYRGDAHRRCAADADDLLQEVWAQALASFATFEYRGEGSFQRWLAGILRNKLHEDRRARTRSPQPAGETGGRPGSGRNPAELLAALADTHSPSRDARAEERMRRVQEALDDLPVLEREALLARYYEGLTLREAGERAGVDPATILHRERRGLNRCARVLGDAL